MYKLYYSPSTASLAVHWMLIELGVPFELVEVNFEAKQQKSPEYLKINPDGRVPALVVGGVAHTECAALLMLLAERHPEVALAPRPGDPCRADYLQWMFYLADTMMPAYRAWFYADEPAGPENVEASKRQARVRIEAGLGRLDTLLQDDRTFLLGEQLTAADFLATMLLRWSRNMPRPATAYPNLSRYVQRMRAMSSLKEVHAREGLTDWING